MKKYNRSQHRFLFVKMTKLFHEHLGEYENIDELNYLAALLSDKAQSDLKKFEAVIDAGEYTGSVKDLINLTPNLDCFEFYSGIHSEEDSTQWLCAARGSFARPGVGVLAVRCANNLNQVAIHANIYGVYPEEIVALQKDYMALYETLSDLTEN